MLSVHRSPLPFVAERRTQMRAMHSIFKLLSVPIPRRGISLLRRGPRNEKSRIEAALPGDGALEKSARLLAKSRLPLIFDGLVHGDCCHYSYAGQHVNGLSQTKHRSPSLHCRGEDERNSRLDHEMKFSRSLTPCRSPRASSVQRRMLRHPGHRGRRPSRKQARASPPIR